MAGAALVTAANPGRQRRVANLAISIAWLVLLLPACGPARPSELTVWAVDEQEWLTVDSPPAPENDIFSASAGRIELTAAINQTVAFQLALRTAVPPRGPYRLDISDLSGSAGTIVADATISRFRMQPVRVDDLRSWYPAHTGRSAAPILIPDILVPWEAPQGGGPLLLTGSGNELVWIDVRVPPTTDPGVYTGTLSLHDARARPPLAWSATTPKPAYTCEVRLRVLPIALPSDRTLPVICRVDPCDLLVAHLNWPREAPEPMRLLPGYPPHEAAVGLLHATMQLLAEHRTNPILWASFPKFQPVDPRRVEVDWEPYDRLVEGWVTGRAFADQVALTYWPIPASRDYPDAQREGGPGSPAYARVLAAYVSECRRHFAERGWGARTFLALCPPESLSAEAVERVRGLGGILRQAEADVPLMAHLPARSLRGLGWRNAPAVDLPDVSIWAPPGMWYEPNAMAPMRALGRATWLMPDRPPYSGTLAIEGLPTDAVVLGWQAYRYQIGALWSEHAARFGDVARILVPMAGREHLIYPGLTYGLPGSPIPSARLKRLRCGLQDHALLTLLERRGKSLLARSLAEQVVRWAGTDACLDSLLNYKETGWPRAARVFTLARELALQELTAELGATPIARLAEWQSLMNEASRVRVTTDGVRLTAAGNKLQATVYCSALNLTNRNLDGRWTLAAPPAGWIPPVQPTTTLPPGSYKTASTEISLADVPHNVDGACPFDLQFETPNLGKFLAPTRLAVATCPPMERAPAIDGDLSDWPVGSSNVAGDFRLVLGQRPGAPSERATRGTQAFFGMDRERLYVAVRCRLGEGEQPVWQADNRVPLDGAVPWGQDVVELLLDPRPTTEGGSGDIYLLQVKPNGVVVTRSGCPTEPPIGKSEPWQSGAVVAVQVQRDAWVIELALPLASLGRDAQTNRLWGCNVTRLDARRGEYSSWSGARGTCYAPRALGNLVITRP